MPTGRVCPPTHDCGCKYTVDEAKHDQLEPDKHAKRAHGRSLKELTSASRRAPAVDDSESGGKSGASRAGANG
jgi:hypothetical protein